MRLKYPFILASQSPRRKELLQGLGIDFKVQVSDVEEIYPEDLAIESIAEYLAELKSKPIIQIHPDSMILASDTIVVCGNRVLGKPQDVSQAKEFLSLLSDATHRVITGVYIYTPEAIHQLSVESLVEIAPLSEAEIEFYIQHYKPFDKAGAYGIQDWMGLAKVKTIQGSYTNIVGLPTAEVYEVLKRYTL
jgi:septum formation protein